MGEEQTVFTFIRQSTQHTDAPQALFGRQITGKV